MTSALVIAISGASGAASVVVAESADSRAQAAAASVSAPVLTSGENRSALPRVCPSARKAVRFYQRRYAEHLAKMGAGRVVLRKPFTRAACPRHLASVLQRKSYATRLRVERWIAQHVLDDFRVVDGARAWHRAVQEAQKPYPSTASWLLSCSASEGGWGRWVPNSQGSGVGGWMQFHPSTFAGFAWRARVDTARRGYIVPASAASWYSPLGQALAGAWGITHGMRHHWAGSGCW